MESKVHPEVVTNIRTAPWRGETGAGERAEPEVCRNAGARAAAALPRELRGRTPRPRTRGARSVSCHAVILNF